MSERKITGVYLNPVDCVCEKRTIDATLEAYYALLDCSLIDVTYRMVNGVRVAIVCDDEGLYAEQIYPSAFDKNDEPVLVGNLFVISPETDDEGNDKPISDKDAEVVMAATCYYYDADAELRLALSDVEAC